MPAQEMSKTNGITGKTTSCGLQTPGCVASGRLSKEQGHTVQVKPDTHVTHSRKLGGRRWPWSGHGKDGAAPGEKDNENGVGGRALPSEAKSAKFSSITSWYRSL